MPSQSRWFHVSWFVIASVAPQLNIGLLIYWAALAWATLRALRQPVEGLWLLFFTFAVGVVSIPPEYSQDFGGDAPRAYFYWGFSLACIAGAMWFGSWLKPRRFQDERRSVRWGLPFLLFLGVVFLASVNGYLLGNGAAVIVRQGSGCAFLFLFIWLGYRLRPSVAELSENLQHIEVVLFAYASVYLVRVVYVNLALRSALPEGDFFRERNPILFFCGLFAALELGRWIFRGLRSVQLREWLVVSVLLAAAALSGSRAIVASALVTVLVFSVVQYAKRPVRMCLFLLSLLLIGYWLNSQGVFSQIAAQSGFLQHIADRYFVSPELDSSFLQRSSQMGAIWEGLKSNPWLGSGVGASLLWFDPYMRVYHETSFVDTGVGYLLLKMGLMGLCAFLVFLAALFWRAWRCCESNHHEIFLMLLGTLTYYSAYLPFGPSFFQFLSSFWIGILIGCLYLVDQRGQTGVRLAVRQPRVQVAS